ncbi:MULTISPECIES: hypothetical protein [unclassified Agrococcus]|uniref:DUF7882 family protein n=1 Tax=unclassified Agrococcus TaxID=2615065 RepID=UPI0036230567
MGVFHNGELAERLTDDDLALLRAVVAVKRTQDEPFLASFVDGDANLARAHWLSRASRVWFEFDAPGAHPVDGWHLDLQLAEAGSDRGVHLRVS